MKKQKILFNQHCQMFLDFRSFNRVYDQVCKEKNNYFVINNKGNTFSDKVKWLYIIDTDDKKYHQENMIDSENSRL
jgi:translation elongation factor EF-1alpha